MTNVAIYSALYGQYEYPKALPDLGVPAYLITDEKDIEAPGWEVNFDETPGFFVDPLWNEVQKADPAATKPMMEHKFWKTHPEEACGGVDVSIWLDASMEVTDVAFVDRCLDALGDDDWVAVKHPWRDCIYDEATYSGTLSRYNASSLDRQAAFYRDVIGHPTHWGLFATGAMVRRHTTLVLEIGEDWWDECCNWGHQDQVSLPVLFRLHERLKWNTNMPWEGWWINHPHER